MRDLEDEKRIKEYMAAKMKHIKMYNECMNLADGLDVAKFAELVRADEREQCAKVCEARYMGDNNREDMEARRCAEAIRARSEAAPIKREWEELDVNEVIELIHEHITNLTPELTGELYGLVAAIDRRLQEKNV